MIARMRVRWLGATLIAALAAGSAGAGDLREGDGAGEFKAYAPESGVVLIDDFRIPMTAAARESLLSQLATMGWQPGSKLASLIAKYDVRGGVIQSIMLEWGQ